MKESGAPACVGESSISRTPESDRNLRATLWIFLAAGTFFTLVNLGWPIARNALCYAKAALGIIAHDFNLFAIGHDRAWTAGKPIFFSAFAAPFVRLFGANAGTITASAIGTAFFLWMVALALPRLNKLSGLDPSLMPLELVLVASNPLVLYQFWSAYPDSLFASLVMLAFILTDLIATEPERDTRWHILGLGMTIYLAIHTKLYGAVLLLTCPLYLLIYGRQLVTRSRHRSAKVGILAAVFAALAIVMVTAKLGINPLLDLAEGGVFGGYVSGIVDSRLHDVIRSLYMFGFAVLLVFQAALLFLARRAAWRAWAPAPSIFAAIYLLGLLPFPGTGYNMRYFLPAFPFLVPALAAGARSIRPMARGIILGAYGAIAFILILNFNLAPVERMLHPILSKASARYELLNAWLDNLRLPVQVALKKQIEAANAGVPLGSALYWSSDYYATATHGLAEYLGIKKGLDIRYVLQPSEIQASPGPVFLMAFTSDAPPDRLWQPPSWATVNNAGYGLFRLDPISVELVPMSGDFVKERNPIRLQAKVTIGDHLKISTVEFIEGEKILGSDRQQPFELNWLDAAPGRHEIVARVKYGERDVMVSESVVVHVGIPVLEHKAKTIAGLAQELPDGFVGPPYDALYIAANKGTSGIRFDKLDAPRGAHIANAYLEFTTARPELQPAALEIHAELSANASALKFEKSNLSRRHRTTASVNWEPSPWMTVGEHERSPNLAPILEEVFAQLGWRPGNAVVLLIHGSGRRVAQAFDEDGRGAPKLYIELQPK